LLLYWFPIFMGVAVGTTLLGGLPRPRGAALALICAIFWIALVQSHLDVPFWRSGGLLLSTLAGAGAIALMGLCGSEHPLPTGLPPAPAPVTSSAIAPVSPWGPEESFADPTRSITALRQFEGWLEGHRHCDDPWADFDEFLRGMIYQWVGGTHVRTFQVLDSGEHLAPLHAAEPDEPVEMVSARTGVIGYVATTGRAFELVAGDSTQDSLIGEPAKLDIANPGTL
jgi:hypothetical protein